MRPVVDVNSLVRKSYFAAMLRSGDLGVKEGDNVTIQSYCCQPCCRPRHSFAPYKYMNPFIHGIIIFITCLPKQWPSHKYDPSLALLFSFFSPYFCCLCI